jgi:hypothetical protein
MLDAVDRMNGETKRKEKKRKRMMDDGCRM